MQSGEKDGLLDGEVEIFQSVRGIVLIRVSRGSARALIQVQVKQHLPKQLSAILLDLPADLAPAGRINLRVGSV
jgi:hypothetical protein